MEFKNFIKEKKMLGRIRRMANIAAIVDGDTLEHIERGVANEKNADHDFSMLHPDETVEEFNDHE